MILRPLIAVAALGLATAAAAAAERGSVIFFHPDGAALNHWGAYRMLAVGPDGETNWDRLPGMAVYTGHMKDALTGTSHGGATVHAWGVKVAADSFGLDGDEPIRAAASGERMSIMQEAVRAGRATGLVQTGHIGEPGTAAFVASVRARSDNLAIAAQVLESGVQVIMAGGERFLLPQGVQGRHGTGMRTDGRDLIAEARARGYTVVFTREELAALDLARVERLLGVFASGHTFSDQIEERNREQNLPNWVPTAPTVAEMSRAALAILSRDPDGFFLVVEEEGTDNFANVNNASGTLEALARADEAIGMFREFVARHGRTLLLTAADSDAGGMQVVGPARGIAPGRPLPPTDRNGSPVDGVGGTATAPFVSAPDRNGKQWPFAVTWSTQHDTSGAILARADGLNADRLRGRIDNTGIYRLMYETLFGRPVN